MRGKCKATRDGYHQPTIIGDPYSKMTYYSCLQCGKVQERCRGAFYGQEHPVHKTLEERLDDIDNKLQVLVSTK